MKNHILWVELIKEYQSLSHLFCVMDLAEARTWVGLLLNLPLPNCKLNTSLPP